MKTQFAGGLPLALIRLLGRQVLLALNFLANKGYAHLDIKVPCEITAVFLMVMLLWQLIRSRTIS
jgi:serine/threonine protein kinase